MSNQVNVNPGTSKSTGRSRGYGSATIGYGLKYPMNKPITSSAIINNSVVGGFNNYFPVDYSNSTHSIPTNVGNFLLSRGHPMITPLMYGIREPFATSPMNYSHEYSPELTAENSATYAADDDSGNTDAGTPFPSNFAAIMKHYELLRSFEELNAKVHNESSGSNNEETNDTVNKSITKNRESGSYYNDEISKNYLEQMKASHLLKKMGKFSVPIKNSNPGIPHTEPKVKDAEQQTDAVLQRNVSQQTFSINCDSESDYVLDYASHYVDSKKRKNNDYRDFEYEKRHYRVENMRISSGNVDLKSVAGLSDVKIEIREGFILPLTHPHLFQSFQGRRCCRCLLYGPPGTGKTLLAQAIASELGADLFYVSCAGILSCYIGESEKNVRELFEYVLKQEEPSIIFFDEIDSVCRRRTEGESEHSRRLKTELLKYFENSAMEESQAYILSATNCPWDLDPAFMRRFQRQIYVPLPDREARQQIISQQLGQLKVILAEEDWTQILNQTEGFSGSDITNFVSIALAQPNRELLRATHWRYVDGDHVIPSDPNAPNAFSATLDDVPPEKIMARSVKLSDFSYAAQETPRTVTEQHILRFENFRKKFYR